MAGGRPTAAECAPDVKNGLSYRVAAFRALAALMGGE